MTEPDIPTEPTEPTNVKIFAMNIPQSCNLILDADPAGQMILLEVWGPEGAIPEPPVNPPTAGATTYITGDTRVDIYWTLDNLGLHISDVDIHLITEAE